MPKTWVRERKKEHYYRKAKKEKLRSRAAYKLLQVARKYRFIKPNAIIVDLGAAPGGWIQACLRIVGDEGLVLAVDLKQIEPFDSPNVRTLIDDITNPQAVHSIREFLPRPADVVISDVSPNISGIWELDHFRQIELARCSLHIANSVLRSKGNLFVKVFQGKVLDDFVREVKQNFASVRLVKPKASRARSAELYVLGMSLRRTH
ncbi:MAG: RlmE family RNA methyltransferase [Candidatus Bathyarchaeota archaeon]|nr:MAG: RlmE family RNA methyltransferase [Candidatus Bathyarchaeota archaeon]